MNEGTAEGIGLLGGCLYNAMVAAVHYIIGNKYSQVQSPDHKCQGRPKSEITLRRCPGENYCPAEGKS